MASRTRFLTVPLPAACAARHPLPMVTRHCPRSCQWLRRWFEKPLATADQWPAFGAVCPARGVAAGLALPFAGTAAMNAHLAEIARTVARSSGNDRRIISSPSPPHALLILDSAGCHGGQGPCGPRQRLAADPAALRARTGPGREPPAVPACKLARDQRLRRLRRHRRRLLRRLEPLRRRSQGHHLDHLTRLGTGQSLGPLV